MKSPVKMRSVKLSIIADLAKRLKIVVLPETESGVSYFFVARQVEKVCRRGRDE